MFYGYCFFVDGMHTEAVNLESPEDVWNYVQLQKQIFPEVRITDEDDFCVVQALDGKIAFPPEWVEVERMLG